MPLYLALKFLFYAARQHFHAGRNATEALSAFSYSLLCAAAGDAVSGEAVELLSLC